MPVPCSGNFFRESRNLLLTTGTVCGKMVPDRKKGVSERCVTSWSKVHGSIPAGSSPSATGLFVVDLAPCMDPILLSDRSGSRQPPGLRINRRIDAVRAYWPGEGRVRGDGVFACPYGAVSLSGKAAALNSVSSPEGRPGSSPGGAASQICGRGAMVAWRSPKPLIRVRVPAAVP